tara:strand:+ start:122 stop:1135 length:1014 start_codon:yes stop_codon:yes gene_type:complete
LSVEIKNLKLLKSKLKNKQINQIYKKFEKSLQIKEKFAVAVSGGPDSLALAFLAKIYSLNKNIISNFYIVDHGLRPESTKEANTVKKILKNYFINAKILTWRGRKPTKNVQALARKKRYELLFAECEKFRINDILLGHHQDDLIENFFIRILRGSGIKGLVSFGKKTTINNINLWRPLIDHKKKDLVFLSKYIFNFYVKDPTNNDDKYQRIKIRKLIKELQKNGFDTDKFYKTIRNLKYSNSVINFYVNQNICKNSIFFEKKKKIILNNKFFQQPHEVVFRAFSESIKLIGKKYYPVRGKKLDKLINDLENNQSIRVTLGGCIVEKVNQTVIISKEN